MSMRTWIFGLSMSLVTLSNWASNLRVASMFSFLNQSFCVGSLISEASEDSSCIPWARREIASPFYDAHRSVVYIGGSDGLLHELDPRLQRVNRQLPLSGNLRAKPVLVDNQLYFATDDGTAMAVNIDTWEISWKAHLDAEVHHEMVLDDDTLYLSTGAATIYALSRHDGSVVWYQKRPLPSRIILSVQSNPLIYEVTDKDGSNRKMLACGHASGVVNFYRAKTGESVFNVAIGDMTKDFPDVGTTPVISGDDVIVASFNRGIVALDKSTGVMRWIKPEKGVTRLATGMKRIFAAGALFALSLEANHPDARWRFHFERGAPTPMLLKNGSLYFASDRDLLYVLNASTGEPQNYLGSGLGFAGDLDFSSNSLFMLSTTGYLLSISDQATGTKKHRYSTAAGGAFGW